MTILELAAGTLNTSTGRIVSAAHLGAALRAGSLDAIDDEKARACVAYLFVELAMHLAVITRCCDALGVPIAQAQKLYLQTLAEGLPRVPAWEKIVADSA